MTKKRPILFNGEMVRAILSGEKTQTRRVIKPQPSGRIFEKYGCFNSAQFDGEWICPQGKPGDRLWVRETWGSDNWEYIKDYKENPWKGQPCRQNAQIHYRAQEQSMKTDHIFPKGYWKPSIHMNRAFSRIDLEITGVRVERVQDISDADAKAEGISEYKYEQNMETMMAEAVGQAKYKPTFSFLWDSINKDRGLGWDDNPWVWVIDFKRTEGSQ